MAPRPNLGASMSSTLIVPAGDVTQSSFPQATDVGGNNNNNDNGPSLQQKGANYFFGFLIAFVVLLLVFVACGITSRRRFLARRGPLAVGNVDPWGASAGNERVQQQEPVFYERYVGDSALAEDRWRYTTPLSASLVRGARESPAEGILRTGVEAPAEATHVGFPERAPVTNRRALPSFLRSWLSKSSEAKREASLDEKTELIESPESLEISVVIAMPARPNPTSSSSSTHPDTFPPDLDRPLSPSQPELSSYTPSPLLVERNANDSEKGPAELSLSRPHSAYLPEYQLGMTTVPWHAELKSTSPPP